MNSSSVRAALGSLALASSLIFTACGTDPGSICASTVTVGQVASPSTGVVTAAGNFAANESVTLRYTQGGADHDVTGTVSTDRKVMTYTGVPAGTQVVKFYVTCGVAGTYEISEATVAVK